MLDLLAQSSLTLGFSIPLTSFLAIAAPTVLFATALVLMLIVALHLERRLVRPVTFSGLGLAVLLSIVGKGSSFPSTTVLSHLYNDSYATFFQLSLLLVAAILSLLGNRYFEAREDVLAEFNALLLFGTLGLMVMVAAQDLILLFLGMEIAALASTIMIGALLPEKRTREAALKFFVFGLIGSAVFLMGAAYLYGATGTVSFVRIGQLSAISLHKSSSFALGASLLIVGFGFKIAAVPFHMWAPDVYDGAPTPVTAFVSVSVFGSVFAVFAKVVIVSLDALPPHFLNTLLGTLAAGTMIWGNLAALSQTNLKRLLAYSSIAHAGYLLLAVTVRSASDLVGPSLMFYFFSYMLMTLGAFAILMIFESQEKGSLNFEEYTGLGRRYPALASCFAVFLLSLAGVPPTMGFVARWKLISNAMAPKLPGLTTLAVIAIIVSLLAVYTYFRVIVVMFMKEPTADTTQTSHPFPFEQRTVLALSVALLILGVFPQSIQSLASRGVLPPIARKAAERFALAQLALKNQKPTPGHRRVVVPQVRPHRIQPPIQRRTEPRRITPPSQRRQVKQRQNPPQRVEPRRVEPRATTKPAPATRQAPTTRAIQRPQPSTRPAAKPVPRPTTRPAARPVKQPNPAARPTPRPAQRTRTKPATRRKVVIKALLPLKATRLRARPVKHRHHHHDHDGHAHGKPQARPLKRTAKPVTPPAQRPSSKRPVVQKTPARAVPSRQAPARKVPAKSAPKARTAPTSKPATRPATSKGK
jgi:NADH-quinone oxidoreductase subunit N